MPHNDAERLYCLSDASGMSLSRIENLIGLCAA